MGPVLCWALALFAVALAETIFNIPGLGRAVFEGVQRQEGTVVVGIVTFLVVIYLVANLVVDVLYAVLDPRIRYH